MDFKKGDRVKVVEKDNYAEGLVGIVRGVHPPSLTYYNVGVDFEGENVPPYMTIDRFFETFNPSHLVKIDESSRSCEICGTTTDQHTNELCFK